MDGEASWVYERMKLYELVKAEPKLSNRQYARLVGHDHNWVRKWRQRFQDSETLTLKTFQSQSRAPKKPPESISEAAKDIVCQLRDELSEKFHRKAGAKTILYALKQYRSSQNPTFRLPSGTSSIKAILRERGYVTPKPKQLREPLILPSPMEEWELDFAEIRLSEEEIFEFLLVMDRGSSRLVYLEGSSGYNAESALEAVARLFVLHGLPKRLRFDRDVRLWGARPAQYPSSPSRFTQSANYSSFSSSAWTRSGSPLRLPTFP